MTSGNLCKDLAKPYLLAVTGDNPWVSLLPSASVKHLTRVVSAADPCRGISAVNVGVVRSPKKPEWVRELVRADGPLKRILKPRHCSILTSPPPHRSQVWFQSAVMSSKAG